MGNRTSLIILIVVVLFLIAGFVGYTFFFNQNQVEINNVVFTIPDGYHQTDAVKDKEINMTNGNNSMILLKCTTLGIQKNIHDYQKYKSNRNSSTQISNFTVNNITVYKVSVVNDTGTLHYWFDYDKKTFSVYTWDANKNCDDFVFQLVSSIKSK